MMHVSFYYFMQTCAWFFLSKQKVFLFSMLWIAHSSFLFVSFISSFCMHFHVIPMEIPNLLKMIVDPKLDNVEMSGSNNITQAFIVLYAKFNLILSRRHLPHKLSMSLACQICRASQMQISHFPRKC